MSLFAQHPLRQTLSDEIHARPPTPLQTLLDYFDDWKKYVPT